MGRCPKSNERATYTIGLEEMQAKNLQFLDICRNVSHSTAPGSQAFLLDKQIGRGLGGIATWGSHPVRDLELMLGRDGWFWATPAYGSLVILICLSLMVPSAAVSGPDKDRESPGLVIELAAKESTVLQIVKDVAEDSVVRGTHVYEKEQTLSGAMPAKSSDYFGPWQGSGHVFYKVLTGALAPRHFKDSSDLGAITVRYIVQPVNELRTRLRIDAVFVESGRRRADASDGSVEAAEFKAIQDSLKKLELVEQEAAEASAKRQKEEVAKRVLLRQRDDETVQLTSAQASVAELEQRVKDLRRHTQMRVKEPGGQLLSAPFHSAAVLQSLPGHTELLLLIITPYWYGVETPAGQHGWVHRQQLEPLP